MGSTFERTSRTHSATSMLRRMVCALLAVCLVAGLNPAAALAAEPYGTGVGSASDPNVGQRAAMSTDVGVAVRSAFEPRVDNEEAIVVDDARKLESGAYTLRGSLRDGQPMRDGAGLYYEYKWVRQVWTAGEGAAAGTWADDTAYNEAHAAWLRADVADAAADAVQVPAFDLNDVRDTLDFAGQARYRYFLVAKDSVLERTSANNVEVVCSAHYADAEVSAPALDDAIYVRGLMHVGNPQLHATELGTDSAVRGLFLQALEGLALDSAFDLAITEQQAANHGEPAYLEPLAYIQIPLSTAVPADAQIEVLGVAASGAQQGSIVKLTDVSIVEQDGVRYAQIASGATDTDAAAALVCGAFAVAYTPPASKPPVNVTSRVESGSSLINIMGTHAFAQGTTVRYTFLPEPGYRLSVVTVIEGDPAHPTSSRYYYPDGLGGPYDNFGANWLDYLVAPTNPSNPEDVIITAWFTTVDMENPDATCTVTAATGSGEGSVQIVGGSNIPGTTGTQLISVKAGSAVTIQFIPGETNVLDYVEVTTGEGSAAVVERPQVLGDTLMLPAVVANTSVVAHFKYGTPAVYPDANISYAPPVGNGSFGEGNPTSAPYGVPITVQAVPEAGFRTVSVWFTFDDDEAEIKHPLRYSGAGTSWILDHVLGDITVHVGFASTAREVRVVANEGGSVTAAYRNAQGNPVDGVDASAPGATLGDVAKDSDLQLTVVPETGKLVQVSIVSKTGEKQVVSGADGVYAIDAAALAAETFGYVDVEFRDAVIDMLSVGLEMPDAGVKVYRTDVAGAGEIAPGTTRLEGIDPNTGLSLRVELVKGYEKLAVEVLDAEGNVIHTATIAEDGAVQIAPEFISAENTVRISCSPSGVVPPEHGDIEVIASTDGNGQIATTDKTSFTTDEELTDITYTITANAGYALDYIAISGSEGNVDARTFVGTPTAEGAWSFKLPAALIAAGYDRVLAAFKQLPEPGGSYWVSPIVVDEAGDPASGDAAHGTVSPDVPFEVAAGGVATLNFTPESGYVAEVSVGALTGPWAKVPGASYIIGMDGGITQDTTVYIRFVEGGDQPQPTYYTIIPSVFGGTGGSISPAETVQVAEGGAQAFSFRSDTGYRLTSVVIDAGMPNETTYSAQAIASMGGQFIFTDVSADHTIQAVFAEDGIVEDTVVWNVSGSEHGAVSPSGSVQVLVSEGGRDVQITPDEGYMIGTVLINGVEVNLMQQPGFTGTSFGGVYRLPAEVGGGGTFHVTFVPRPTEVMLHVKVNGAGGSTSPADDTPVNLGAQQTVTFVPDEGYRLEYARFVDAQGAMLPNGDFTQAALTGGYSYTFTMSGETWIECAFTKEGGENPPKPDEQITVTAVSVGAGKINPYGPIVLYPNVEGSKVTFTLTPDAGAQLVQLTVGGRDVTADVRNGTYTLLATDARDGDEVRAVFEKNPVVRGSVELTAGSGGRISPEGSVQPEVGSTLPVSFIPDDGMKVEGVQLTYVNPDGTTWTKTIRGSMNYYNVPVTADLVGVHVTFTEAGGSVPAVKKATVKAEIAPGNQDMGGVSPEAGKVVEVVQGGSALFSFQPKPGYRVASAKLNGGANLVQVGATQVYVRFAQLLAVGADANTATLEVTFEKIPANPDYVNIIVDVNTSTSGAARSGIVVGEGGSVSPSNIRVPFGSSEVYQFYVFPEDGYKLASITASVDGGAAVDLDYSTSSHDGSVNDVSAIVAGDKDGVHGSGSDAGDDAATPETGGARYYLFQLKNITGNVDVQVDFVGYTDDKDDDAINGGGKRVQLTVEAGEGGFVSPSGTMTLPEGCTYPFLIEPESSSWEPSAVVITYADGTKKIIEDVKAGRFPITITGDMTHISVAFEQVAMPVEMVKVTAQATGPGSVSPAGTFEVKKGASQAFTFKFDTPYSYIKSLVVEHADGTTQDLAADGWVWKFDTAYYEYGVDSDLVVRVEFAEGDERNPMWDDLSYVRLTALATTDGAAGTQGGTIEPAGEMWMQAGMGSQLLCFKPNRGYVVDYVSVVEGSGADAKVRLLSAEELASREVLVSGIEADTVVTASFVRAFYTVDITSGDGGQFNVEGMGIQVRQGQRLGLYAQPEDAHELDRISTSGLVVHDETAVDDPDQVDRVESLGGSANASGELHTFAVAGSGAVHGTFKAKSQNPGGPDNPGGPSNPDNPNNPGGSDNPGGNNGNGTTEQLTVKVSSSGNGEVDPSGTMAVAKGSTITLNLKPAVGYYPASITLKTAQGQTDIANAARTFTMKVQEDCELVANFSSVAAPGTSNPVNRAVHTLQSLAQTGDNAMVGMLALVALACAGAGLMLMTRRRTKKDRSE